MIFSAALLLNLEVIRLYGNILLYVIEKMCINEYIFSLIGVHTFVLR